MIEPDTVRLLRECDAGIQMGTQAIEGVMERVKDAQMRRCLADCRKKHEKLAAEIENELKHFHDEGKDAHPVLRGMSFMKTSVRLAMDATDENIADLLTDGCNMGVKCLNRYLNQYKAADEKAKDITKKLIQQEEELKKEISRFL